MRIKRFDENYADELSSSSQRSNTDLYNLKEDIKVNMSIIQDNVDECESLELTQLNQALNDFILFMHRPPEIKEEMRKKHQNITRFDL